jgi:hypothetical protein
MLENFKAYICQTMGAKDYVIKDVIQELWSGYGKILRLELKGCASTQIVVKFMSAPGGKVRNSDVSHQRKLRSYQVEKVFYENWGAKVVKNCRLPTYFGFKQIGSESVLLLEDLDDAGYYVRKHRIQQAELRLCVQWLATFHAKFMGTVAQGLWKQGTYWHLQTRPEELRKLEDIPLKNAAAKIDQLLAQASFQTFVHGDAKLENFCFAPKAKGVAMVDFQYVGKGCGMKDLAYFASSIWDEHECEARESELLDLYFAELHQALSKTSGGVKASEVEAQWRELYPVAWTDFHRFYKGWSPQHWSANSYSEKVKREVLQRLT